MIMLLMLEEYNTDTIWDIGISARWQSENYTRDDSNPDILPMFCLENILFCACNIFRNFFGGINLIHD